MACVGRLTPAGLRKAFEMAWFKVIDQDKFKWTMARGDCDEPFLIPRRCKLIAPEIMDLAYDFEPETDLRERINEILLEEQALLQAAPTAMPSSPKS